MGRNGNNGSEWDRTGAGKKGPACAEPFEWWLIRSGLRFFLLGLLRLLRLLGLLGLGLLGLFLVGGGRGGLGLVDLDDLAVVLAVGFPCLEVADAAPGEEVAHGVAGLSTLAQPELDALLVDVDLLGGVVGEGVEVPEGLDDRAVAAGLLLRRPVWLEKGGFALPPPPTCAPAQLS